MINRIAILGAGWLGLPLGDRLTDHGYFVRGSSSRRERLPHLQMAGLQAHFIRLSPDDIRAGHGLIKFMEAEVLIITIPPGSNGSNRARYPAQIMQLVPLIQKSPVQWVVFTSSTGVYVNLNREVQEDDALPLPAPDKPILSAESMLLRLAGIDVTILRYGGLYGGDRELARHFAGKTAIANGRAPVNLVHREDAVEATYQVIKQNHRNDIFNVVADGHPTRQDYYNARLEQLKLPLASFQDELLDWKSVSNAHLKDRTGYRFRWPTQVPPIDLISRSKNEAS